MTFDESRRALVALNIEKADTALAAISREIAAGDFNLAVNRAYYACFYAASAVLLQHGRHFVKHKGVKSAVHEYLIKKLDLPVPFGTFYDKAFKARGEADYVVEKKFIEEEAREFAHQADGFVKAMKQSLEQD